MVLKNVFYLKHIDIKDIENHITIIWNLKLDVFEAFQIEFKKDNIFFRYVHLF